MIHDPYKVLGVPPTASDDEIKKAYRTLAKKYHPDVNPGNKSAEQRMNEINAAYDQIKNPSQQSASGGYGGFSGAGSYGGSGGYSGFGGRSYGGFSGTGSDSDPLAFRTAVNYINSRRYQEALNTLSGVPAQQRNARWYCLCALANYGLGNRISAISMAEMAVRLDPGNIEYISLLNELKMSGSFYQTYSQGFPSSSTRGGICPCCLSVFLYTLLCRCFPGYC